MNWFTIVISVAQAVLKALLIALSGFFLAKRGILDKELQRGISVINLYFFTPCLLFGKMSETISPTVLLELWPIPTVFAFITLAGYLVASVQSSLLRLTDRSRKLVATCIMFCNSNTIAIPLIESLAYSSIGREILRLDPHETPAITAARGISYVVIFSTLSNIVRWSYGAHLLDNAVAEDDEEVEEEFDPSTSVVAQRRSLLLPDSATMNEYEALSSITSPELQALTAVSTTANIRNQKVSWWRSIIRTLSTMLNPPLLSTAAAVVVGLIPPLQRSMYSPSGILLPVQQAINMCGEASIPLILVALGGSFSDMPAAGMNRKMRLIVIATISGRLLIVPPMALGALLLIRPYILVMEDPMFMLTMLLLSCTPTALNLMNAVQAVGTAYWEEVMARVLFWSYLLAIPVMLLELVGFISVVNSFRS